jgi:hypothetical protein
MLFSFRGSKKFKKKFGVFKILITDSPEEISTRWVRFPCPVFFIKKDFVPARLIHENDKR